MTEKNNLNGKIFLHSYFFPNTWKNLLWLTTNFSFFSTLNVLQDFTRPSQWTLDSEVPGHLQPQRWPNSDTLNIDGLVQDGSNFIANALELLH